MKQFKKEYKDYEEYIDHQKSKLEIEKDSILKIDEQYFIILSKRLLEDYISVDLEHGNVLCLGARLGAEVRAFIKLGVFAVGIDLNPGKDNKYVLCGDFHNIQFSNKSVDIIFSNSLDHSFYFSKVFNEIKRVLKDKGTLILEIANGFEEGTSTGYYESFHWAKVDDIIEQIEDFGFTLIKKYSINFPEKGSHCVFRLI